MIRINYLEVEGKISSLEVKGHANYDEKGKDIVCSAVSAIVVGGINSLKNLDNIDVIIEDGYIKVDGEDLKDDLNQIVLNVIITQLLTIEKSYSSYVKVLKC